MRDYGPQEPWGASQAQGSGGLSTPLTIGSDPVSRPDDSIADNPAELRRYLAETKEFVNRVVREGYETTFGLSAEALKSDPKLLDYFLRHDNPRLRACAITFVAQYYGDVGRHFGRFTQECLKLSRSDPDQEIRKAAICALSTFYTASHDKNLLTCLARFVLDPEEEEPCRKIAYMGFTNAVAVEEIHSPGGFEALIVRFREILSRDISDYERGFVRSVLARRGIEIPG